MSYPTEIPTNKHDLVVPMHLPPGDKKLSHTPFLFRSVSKLFNGLHPPKDIKLLSFVYSYPDSPSKPLSRALYVAGFVEQSSLRNLVDAYDTPDCVHKCRLSVRRPPLEDPKHEKNTPRFTNLMKKLRNEKLVAVLATDKLQRMGFLVPVENELHMTLCYMGNPSNIREFLETAEATSEPVYQPQTPPVDGFQPHTPPVDGFHPQTPPMDVSEPQWKPSTPPPPDDSEPQWKPSTPPPDEPAWKPSTPPPPDESEPAWKPSTPPPPDDSDEAWKPSTPPPADGMEWKPSTPPPDDGGDWKPSTPPPPDDGDAMWKPPGADDSGGDDGGMWKPPGADSNNDGWGDPPTSTTADDGWGDPPPANGEDNDESRKRKFDDLQNNTFHTDNTAAAADAFYSGLKRDLGTRADSQLFHMRNFNGWVKATQIQELDPRTSSKRKAPMRVLDLACGKGGDLGKWTLHDRGVVNYVGVDVARGSLKDAAIRARKMRNKLKRCTFTCADLGSDVPGRLRSAKHKKMQKLSSWSLHGEGRNAQGDPKFDMVRGGGISLDDRFDVISIQFAIHYMMSTRTRARRFFQTASQLLEVGGNLICTTIDARIVLNRLMNLGLDYHFVDPNQNKFEKAVVTAGNGQCRITFEPETVEKIFKAQDKRTGEFDAEELFGLEYSFTLVEGSDHAAGVGDAVNLPEWLNPIPVLKALAEEVGMELESAENFHEFYNNRRSPMSFPLAHAALYNMKVLDRNGSIPPDNWDISRMYVAIKFRKVKESKLVLEEEEDKADEEEDDDDEEEQSPPPPPNPKLIPMAMMKAKRIVGADRWQELDGEEKKRLINQELAKMSAR